MDNTVRIGRNSTFGIKNLGKTKDGVNARLDLAELGVKLELFAMQEEDKTTLPPASYTLTNAEKDTFYETLHNIRVPQDYCSNFTSLVNLKDRKLIGLKSHDYHMLMHDKEIILQELDKMQAELVVTLCLLEKFFPSSFFDIMIHLTMRLTREIFVHTHHRIPDTMADVNVNAPTEQAPAMAPPTSTDDQILPRIRWVPIGKSNCYLDVERSQSNPIYKIAVDILKHTNFFRAFTASSTIPSIYIQQFWEIKPGVTTVN
ncbi:putative reverse transcriptase domain-containing protein [Tanacetum coccineum]